MNGNTQSCQSLTLNTDCRLLSSVLQAFLDAFGALEGGLKKQQTLSTHVGYNVVRVTRLSLRKAPE